MPPSGPLVIVANHRNALVDPLILIATLPRTLRPVAKAPLFRHPILAPFLRLAGALPVHRRQDPGQRPRAERRHVPCGGDRASAGRGDPHLPGGGEPARARADAAPDGRRQDGAGNGGRSWAHRRRRCCPSASRSTSPGRSGTAGRWCSSARRCRSTTAAPWPRGSRSGPSASSPRRVAEALRALIVEAEDRETLRLAEGLEAVRRAEDGGPARGQSSRGTTSGGAGRLGPGRHPRVPLAGAPRARAGGALPRRGRELSG